MMDMKDVQESRLGERESFSHQLCYTYETCKTSLLYERKNLLYKYINLTETYEENSKT